MKDYIAYVKNHGGENTVELAEAYSKDVLSPLLGNEEGKQYRYWRIQSLLYNGGYLYHNGGNMFYPDIVKMNEKIIETYEKVFK
ncbi:pneumococcal vaccine antigen A family protein [Enterococcus faecium]|nr:pneumococcal vaccine antigen A family protein [Enterococcus faecium]